MRVAALAPLAALLVTLANAAPVPVADPFSFCFFGFGNGCDNTPTTSVAAIKTTSSSIKATSTSSLPKITSSSAVSSVKSSSVSSSAKAAATTQSVANWTWLWDPTYVFNMWNNFLTFRWEKYNDCNFNGYSLTYVKAYYYNTYGFKPLTGCQWKDVYNFMDKYAVKNSVRAPSKAVYTPGCANPFGGADSNWKPSTVTSSSVKVSSSSAAPLSAAVFSVKASSSSVAFSSLAASSSKASSSVLPSYTQNSVVQSSAVQSSAAQSSVAQSPAAQSAAAQSSVAQNSAAQSPAASSPAAQSSAIQSSVAQSSDVQSSVAQSSDVQSSAAQSSTVQSSAAQSPAPSGTDNNSSSGSDSATATASAVVVTPTPYGTSVTFSNGQIAQYLGCIQEPVGGRKLTKASIDVPALMTNEYCSNYCSSLGFPVAGSEYAKECYCGTYDQIATYDVSDQCVMPCSGDSTGQSICGGPNALTIHVLASVPVRTVSLPPNWTAQGCFQDNNDRVLPYQAWSGNSATTVESCSAQCASSGYSIAGVEYGTECYCGNSFVGGAVEIDSSNCNFVCPGNMLGEMCGGSWSLSVASSLSAF